MRPVRTISREVAHSWVDPSETTRQGPRRSVGKIWSGLHGDMQRSTEMIDPLRLRFQLIPVVHIKGLGSNSSSEIPCRVSSDLHEWRNDFSAVSTMGSVKLQSR
jgi:hypothetical protein